MRTPRTNALRLLRMKRDALAAVAVVVVEADDDDVGIENHGHQSENAKGKAPPVLSLDAPALMLIPSSSAAVLFGSLNEYRHKRLCRKRRQLLQNHCDVVGQLIRGALDGGGLCEDKGPKLARIDAIGRQIQT